MDDGLFTPGAADGMCAFPGPGGKTILVRNHELDVGDRGQGAFGGYNELLALADVSKFYDRGSGKTPALGGTTTIVYDTAARKVERSSTGRFGAGPPDR